LTLNNNIVGIEKFLQEGTNNEKMSTSDSVVIKSLGNDIKADLLVSQAEILIA
jgi:hypothetical protein